MPKEVDLHVVEFANARSIEFHHAGTKYHEKILEHNVVIADYVNYIKRLYAMFDIKINNVKYTN